jgi:hypothetical protein
MPDRRLLACLLGTALLAVLAAPASAFRVQALLEPLAGNPAEALAVLEPDEERYDPATRCRPKPQTGMVALQRWLERNVRGESWGTYRCEKWGSRGASLHAEGRAIDWHLDVSRPADRAAARRLITLLLAPDSTGTPRALARRMGVEEIIWDCSYWSAGADEFRRYAPCFGANGTPRRRVDRTTAHRNHLHIGMTTAGARGRTSFWLHRR